MEETSPTERVWMPKPITSAATVTIATKDDGTARVNFGRPQMMPMVSTVSPSITHIEEPPSQAPSIVLNCASCAMKITIAKPFTKPYITGCGTSRMNLPSLNSPASICNTPASTTAAKTYSTPCLAANATITTATAPVAPEIMPGLPPRMLVTRPITKAAYRPVSGERPAINAKATASGINASATVRPESTSVR